MCRHCPKPTPEEIHRAAVTRAARASANLEAAFVEMEQAQAAVKATANALRHSTKRDRTRKAVGL